MKSVARSTRMVVVALLAPVAAAYAGSVELTFKTLPSTPAQGWIYEAKGANTMSNDGPFEGEPSCDPAGGFPTGKIIPWLLRTTLGHNLDEEQVFWVKGGQLHLDTVHPCFPTGTTPAEQPGCPIKTEGPFQWHGSDQGGDNGYRRPGVVSKTHPFSLLVTVQITHYSTAWECDGGNPSRLPYQCGFQVGASTGDETYVLCMTDTQVSILNASGPTTLVNMITGDQLHTYRLDVVPRVGASLFIDDETTPRASSSGPIKSSDPTKDPNGLFLGDGTGMANSSAAISKFVYRDSEPPARQGKVPE